MEEFNLADIINQLSKTSVVFEEYSIEDCRKQLKDVVEFFQSQSYFEEALHAVSVERNLPENALREYGCFFIPEDTTLMEIPEWMKNSSLGIVKSKYFPQKGRWVYPVKDVKGNIMGLCGWDKFITPKYFDSVHYGYKAKFSTLWGMEELPKYYTNNKPVYVTEGIVCAFYLRTKGFQSLALLGSNISPYVLVILKRLGTRLILIPDNDEAGSNLVNKVKRYSGLKCAICQVKYGKDIDGCRLENEGQYEDLLLKELHSLDNPFVPTSLLIRR